MHPLQYHWVKDTFLKLHLVYEIEHGYSNCFQSNQLLDIYIVLTQDNVLISLYVQRNYRIQISNAMYPRFKPSVFKLPIFKHCKEAFLMYNLNMSLCVIILFMAEHPIVEELHRFDDIIFKIELSSNWELYIYNRDIITTSQDYLTRSIKHNNCMLKKW